MTENVFSTERLPLACFLHAANKLKFLRAESNGSKAQFIFADPQQQGDEFELQYEQGALVSAAALFASQKFLRRRMSDALGERTRGGSYERYNRR